MPGKELRDQGVPGAGRIAGPAVYENVFAVGQFDILAVALADTDKISVKRGAGRFGRGRSQGNGGFGYAGAGGRGSRAVLEVRSHEVPFILEDGQIIGRLVYEPLTEVPSQVYGQGIGSNYQRQGLKLSKHFRPYDPSKR